MSSFILISKSRSKVLCSLAAVMVLLCLLPDRALAVWPLHSMPEDTTTEPEVLPRQDFEPMSQASELRIMIKQIAEELMVNLAATDSEKGLLSNGLVVTTFVDLKKMYRTSSFGRYLAEQLMGEFQQHEYHVVEVRKAEKIMVQEKLGEFGLSREPDEIGVSVGADAMLTGTYTLAGDQVIVNARILDNRNAMLLSSATVVFPRTPLTDGLLADTASARSKSRGVTYMKRLEM